MSFHYLAFLYYELKKNTTVYKFPKVEHFLHVILFNSRINLKLINLTLRH